MPFLQTYMKMTVRTRGRAPGSKRNEIDFNTSSSSGTYLIKQENNCFLV
jgi:hypothetical protein